MFRTPLTKLPTIDGFSNIYWKDESHNTTGTFKDRLITACLERLRRPTMVSCISYGNTAISLAHHLRVHNISTSSPQIEGCVIIPEDLNEWRLGPSTFGSWLHGQRILEFLSKFVHVVSANLTKQVLDEAELINIARSNSGWTGPTIDITEGIEIAAYRPVVQESIEQMGCFPDVCLVPYGAGILANEILDFITNNTEGDVIPLSVGSRDSAARMLYGPVWLDVEQLRQKGVALSRHKSPDKTGQPRPGYPVYLATEEHVKRGLELAARLGLSCEPSASVGLGFLSELRNTLPAIEDESRILIVGTGNAIDKFESVYV